MFEKRVALVTGASRGIGRAIAVALAKDGAHVIVNYNGSQAAAEETGKLIEEAGGSYTLSKFNVADMEETEAAMKALIAECGRLDILVNNAGITKDGLLMKMSDADFDAVIDVNLKGTFHTIKVASRQMMKQRYGRIVNLSSVSGVMGNAGQANYSASKAGVIGLTKSVARELASRGITSNAVAPGFIATDMTAAMPEAVLEAAAGQIPLGYIGKPEDIAAAVSFLASEQAGYITGQVLCVDGGMAI